MHAVLAWHDISTLMHTNEAADALVCIMKHGNQPVLPAAKCIQDAAAANWPSAGVVPHSRSASVQSLPLVADLSIQLG